MTHFRTEPPVCANCAAERHLLGPPTDTSFNTADGRLFYLRRHTCTCFCTCTGGVVYVIPDVPTPDVHTTPDDPDH